jgi:hypothetical protein
VPERVELLRAASKSFGEHKDRAFEAKQADDAAKLLALQAQYEKELEYKFAFLGLSVSETITRLLVEGLNKRAEHVRSTFKVPDKRFWWIKLKALAATHNWEGLEAFAKSKKSPIGYEPFVVSRIRSSCREAFRVADTRRTSSRSSPRSCCTPRRSCRAATQRPGRTCTPSAGSGARRPRRRRSATTRPSSRS